MPRRRGSTRRNNANSTNRQGARGGIRKNTRNRQPPSRYGNLPRQETQEPGSEQSNSPSNGGDEAESQDPDYSQSLSTNTPPHNQDSDTRQSTPSLAPATPVTPSSPDTPSAPGPSPNDSININTMRDLLRSHEQDIVERVVLRLSSQQLPHFPSQPQNPHAPNPPVVDTLRPVNRTLTRIEELERQLAELGREQDGEQATAPARTRALGMYNPTAQLIGMGGESASGMAESVELLFPGVEQSTLTQIIENRFKPTNIYWLLATEKDRAESQRTISIGGVEFEQAERDEKEAEYRMMSFFKAWAAYTPYKVNSQLP
ncbi:hypothetical protein HOY80DRAFT_1020255 [Tuber brumale]|nr:hypothetical protein HOY80DRAFT_1020255 [Tuber brumale]